MALIKTIAEIKSVIPRLSRLSDTANLPNVNKAGRMHILPLLGVALYKDLDEKANSGETLDEKYSALLEAVRLPLAAFALIDDLAFIHTIITDSGIRTTSTEKMEAAHRWEFNELKEALANYATDGVELLLSFLYENKDDWEAWTSSNEFKEQDGFLIKTGSDFRRYYPLCQPLRTYWALRPVMSEVEENYFVPTLGRGLLAWLKSQEEVVINTEDGQIDIKRLLKRAMAHLAIKNAGAQFAVRFDSNGFTILATGGNSDSPTSAGRQAADNTSLSIKLDAANNEGQNDLTKAAKYLVGLGAGSYNGEVDESFTTAFATSPLLSYSRNKPYSNGNDRRKFFRF